MKTKHFIVIAMLFASVTTFAQFNMVNPRVTVEFTIIDPAPNLTSYPVAFRIWAGGVPAGTWQSFYYTSGGPGVTFSKTFTSNETYWVPDNVTQDYFQIEVRSYDGSNYSSGFTIAKFEVNTDPNTLTGETIAEIIFH